MALRLRRLEHRGRAHLFSGKEDVVRKPLVLGAGLLAGACATALLVSAVAKVRDAADRAH
jgi:hypothetical protein